MDAKQAAVPGATAEDEVFALANDGAAGLRRDAAAALKRLSRAEREAFIIQCWMSHDARWFQAAAMTCGLETAQRINQLAVREEGRVEARRLSRRLRLPEVKSARDYLRLQETIIGLLGPDLLDYRLTSITTDGFDLEIDRCFAHDNVTKAGIVDQYECGIIPRVLGWLDHTGLDFELLPVPGRCLVAQGKACRYSFRDLRPHGQEEPG